MPHQWFLRLESTFHTKVMRPEVDIIWGTFAYITILPLTKSFRFWRNLYSICYINPLTATGQNANAVKCHFVAFDKWHLRFPWGMNENLTHADPCIPNFPHQKTGSKIRRFFHNEYSICNTSNQVIRRLQNCTSSDFFPQMHWSAHVAWLKTFFNMYSTDLWGEGLVVVECVGVLDGVVVALLHNVSHQSHVRPLLLLLPVGGLPMKSLPFAQS
jgi:hypothetical protein